MIKRTFKVVIPHEWEDLPEHKSAETQALELVQKAAEKNKNRETDIFQIRSLVRDKAVVDSYTFFADVFYLTSEVTLNSISIIE